MRNVASPTPLKVIGAAMVVPPVVVDWRVPVEAIEIPLVPFTPGEVPKAFAFVRDKMPAVIVVGRV